MENGWANIPIEEYNDLRDIKHSINNEGIYKKHIYNPFGYNSYDVYLTTREGVIKFFKKKEEELKQKEKELNKKKGEFNKNKKQVEEDFYKKPLLSRIFKI